MNRAYRKSDVIESIRHFFNVSLESGGTKAFLNYTDLRFSRSSSGLEEKFQDKYFQLNLSHLRNCHLYAVFFYAIAGFIDYVLFPQDLICLWAVRFLLVVPFFIAGYFFTFSALYSKVWRELSFFYILLTGGGFVALTVIGRAPEAHDYWVGILICLVFGYAFIREPFIYASAAGAVLTAGYILVAVKFTEIPGDKLILSSFYIMLVNFLGVLISRHLEFSARRDFFLEHILSLEREKFSELNNELERKVEVRTYDLSISNMLLQTKVDELNRSEAALGNFMDNAPIGMYTINLKGEFTYANRKLEEITGYNASEWIGRPFHPIVHPDDLEKVLKSLDTQLREMKTPEPLKIRIINAHNDILWVKITSESVVEEKKGDREITGVLSFVEDITKRRRSQEINKTLFAISNAVSTSENLTDLYRQIHILLGRIIDVTNFFIAIVDERKRTLYFPYSVDTVDEDFSDLEDFDPKESLTGMVVSTRKPLLLREDELRKRSDEDGVWGPLPMIWMGVPLVVKDEIIGVIVVQNYDEPDIYSEQDMEVLTSISDQVAVAIDRKRTSDELARSEEKFRSAFKISPHVITLTRIQDGVYFEVNDAFTKLLGYSSQEAVGRSSVELDIWNDPEDYKRVLSGLEECGLVEDLQADFKGRNGQIVKGLVSARILDIDNMEFILAVTQDVTESARKEKERLALELRLHQAQKMEAIGTLAGGIAHDFNNILAGIMGYSQLALRCADDSGRVSSYIAQIEKGSQRASELVRQILTFSRQDVYRKRPVKICDIIGEAFKLLRSTIPASIEMESSVDSKSFISADPIKIHQLLINLITNASHAIGDNNGRIQISLKDRILTEPEITGDTKVPPGSYLHLEVSDTGAGMDDSVMEKVFDPYFTTKQAGDGTGLGLALAKAIVKEHGGYIRVSSRVGRGTVFSLYFPVLDKEAQGLSEAFDEAINFGGDEMIMFVDDESAIRDITEDILKKYGYRVDVFSNGSQAYAEFIKNPQKYDLIISDVAMPKMSGDRLAENILIKDPNMPVILCTGYLESLSEDRACSMGVRKILHKPVGINDLLKNIRKILDRGQEKHGSL